MTSWLERAVAAADQVQGWMPKECLRVLIQLAYATPPATTIVEVGSYRGRSAVALALGSRQGPGNRVYTFDPHLPFEGVRGGHFGPEDQAAFYRNISVADVGEIVFSVALDSRWVAPRWAPGSVSLLLVDGDHRQTSVEADLEAWFPALCPGAVVALDDIDYRGVEAAAQRSVDRRLLHPIGRQQNLAWYRSKPD